MGTTERTALVTGATSGLGFEAAAQLAALDQGQVIVTGRSRQKARHARDELSRRSGRDVFESLELDVEDGAGRYLRVAGLGDEISGEFYASPNKKMTGELARMDLPHIADRRAQRAGWEAIVRVSGVDMPAPPVARPARVPDEARAA